MFIKIYFGRPDVAQRHHKTSIICIRNMPKKYFLPCIWFTFYRVMFKYVSDKGLLIFLANDTNFSKFSFDILSNRINLSHPCILSCFKTSISCSKFMPYHISRRCIRIDTKICSAGHFNSIYMFYYWVNFVILEVENVFIMDIRCMNENQFHSILFRYVIDGIIELTGNELPISVLYKYNH